MTEAALGTPSLEVAYRYSSNFGASWSDQIILSTVDIYGSDASSAAMGATKEGKVYVDWTDGKYGGTNPFVGSNILRRSTDAGGSWNPEALLTDIPSSISPSIAIDGNIIGVVWNNESQPFEGISLRVSTDTGATWLPHIAVSDSVRPASHADIAISGNRLYVGWSDERTGIRQIYLRRGTFITTSIREGSSGLPAATTLFPAYPNPFNERTVISYSIPGPMDVRLSLYDILGRERAVLVNGRKEPGMLKVTLHAADLASGIESSFGLSARIIGHTDRSRNQAGSPGRAFRRPAA